MFDNYLSKIIVLRIPELSLVNFLALGAAACLTVAIRMFTTSYWAASAGVLTTVAGDNI